MNSNNDNRVMRVDGLMRDMAKEFGGIFLLDVVEATAALPRGEDGRFLSLEIGMAACCDDEQGIHNGFVPSEELCEQDHCEFEVTPEDMEAQEAWEQGIDNFFAAQRRKAERKNKPRTSNRRNRKNRHPRILVWRAPGFVSA